MVFITYCLMCNVWSSVCVWLLEQDHCSKLPAAPAPHVSGVESLDERVKMVVSKGPLESGLHYHTGRYGCYLLCFICNLATSCFHVLAVKDGTQQLHA